MNSIFSLFFHNLLSNIYRNLDTLDHEALFVDLDTEVRQLPSCDVSKAIDWLIRAEIKNELYEIINQDRNNVWLQYHI